LEAAGPKAKESGFISRNNNDMSAENMFRFLKKADLSREVSLLWNIVPWYLGDGKNIKPATKEDIREGSKYLEQLLHLLGNLKAIVLVGKKAQDGFMLVQIDPNIQVFKTVHPSPSNVNSRPEAEEMIVKTFKEVAAFLKTS
jgi:uracil-DNA glycosylase